jgi:DNA-binding NarL/FixJ family response regulator
MVSAPTHIRFTERQRQVIRLIAEGHSNQEIAAVMGVSPRTVKAHSDVLRTKLRVSRRRHIPAAYRDATGEDPHAPRSLGPVPGARDKSRAS